MSHNITVEGGTSVRLPTAGKYCDRDIVVTATGGGGTADPVIRALDVTKNGTYKAPDGVDGYSPVTVNVPIPDGYIQPSGTKTITENGMHDAKAYESVNVNVPIPDGYIKPSGTKEITENGAHDVTAYASVNVSVEASGGGAEDHLDDFLVNTLTAIDSDVTKIVSYGSYGRTALKTVNLPNCTNVGGHAFQGCSGITNVNAPLLTTIDTYGFYGCSKLTEFDMSKIPTIGTYAFYKCDLREINAPLVTGITQNAFFQNGNLVRADFGVANKINQASFANCSKLDTLILRITSSICALGTAASSLQNTPIAKGTGYVYVPKALIETYKAATNWSNYASQFRAIEDYPEITGG